MHFSYDKNSRRPVCTARRAISGAYENFSFSAFRQYGVRYRHNISLSFYRHLWHLVSFVFAFFVSFVLHKFWTFGDRSQEGMHMQMGAYLFVAVVNLSLNTLLVYLFVEQTGLHYIIAQILASALIAIESFFVYQRFIFKTAV